MNLCHGRNFWKLCKKSLADTTFVTFSDVVTVTDASDNSISDVINQNINGKFEPLAFFPRKLTPAEKYFTNDPELSTVFYTIILFHYTLEGTTIKILTHQP